MSTIVTVPCPGCGRSYKTKVADLGKSIRCKACERVFTLAAPTTDAAPRTDGTARPSLPPTLPPASRTSSAAPTCIGRFQVRARLGAGAFGTVYRAYDPQLDREVALKVPRPGTLDGPGRVERFLREARAAARLRHPHIVPVYDAGKDGGHYYIASAFIEGQPLAGAVGTAGMDFRRAAQVVRELAEAAGYAHGQGIVHRDVKPANVMLDGQGRAHLMDFGLAAKQDEAEKLTNEGAILGTPAYMAPEQAAGQRGEARPASDQYALGVVLYELLTGRTPFEGPPSIVLYHALHTEPPPPRSLRPVLPRDLETVCLKAMARRPADRYPDCQALADDLRRWLEGEPIAARRLGVAERLGRWARRNKLVAGLTAAVALALLLGVAFSAYFAAREATQRGRAEERAGAAEAAEGHARAEQREARRDEARLALERGLSLCEQGEPARGLLWLARALRSASEGQDPDLERVARCNLAGWAPEVVPRRPTLPVGGSTYVVAYTADGSKLLTGGSAGARLWEVATGRPLTDAWPAARPVLAAAFSPDGKAVVLGGGQPGSGEARVWAADTGAPLTPPLAHPEEVGAVAFSPDGKSFVTGCGNGGKGEARLYDAATGGQRGAALLPPDAAAVRSVAWSPDGSVVATGSAGGSIQLWDPASGQLRQSLQAGGAINVLAFSPDGRRLLTGTSGQGVLLWDVASGRRLPPDPQPGAVFAAAFSPDGSLFVGGGIDHPAQVWDTATGRPAGHPLSHRGGVSKVAFSPDGRVVLTGSTDQTARLWDARSGRPLAAPLQQLGGVTAVAFDPAGKTVATGSYEGAVRVWDVSRLPGPRLWRAGLAPGRIPIGPGGTPGGTYVWHTPAPDGPLSGRALAQPLTHDREVMAVRFRPDGGTVLTAGWDGTARLWSAETGRPLGPALAHGGMVHDAAFSLDGGTVATAGEDGTARLWATATGQPLGKVLRHGGPVFTVGFSPDGRRVVTGSADRTARLWDARTGEPVGEAMTHGSSVFCTAFSPDGARLVTGSWQRHTRLWDGASGRPLGEPAEEPAFFALAFDPVGRWYAVGAFNRAVRLRKAADGQLVRDSFRHLGPVLAVAFSRDGRWLLTGSRDRTARVWDVETGKPRTGPLAHRADVRAVAFSPDGAVALTGGDDWCARLWDTATGRALGPALCHRDAVVSVAFRPDGRAVATASTDGTAVLWPVPAPAAGTPERLACWAEWVAGLRLDEFDSVQVLTPAEAEERGQHLEALGGPPGP